MERFNYKEGVSLRLIENEKLPGHFRICMFHGNEEVGFQQFELRKDGTYYLSGLVVYEKYREKKFGSNLIECANDFLRSKKAVGYLNNTIEDRGKYDLYESHGWKNITGNVYMFDGRVQPG